MINFNVRTRTLLEAGEVPVWKLTRLAYGTWRKSTQGHYAGAIGKDQYRGVLSPWARAVVAGLSLRESEGQQFEQRFAIENPLEDASILELSGAGVTPTTPTTARMISIPVAAPLIPRCLARDTDMPSLASDISHLAEAHRSGLPTLEVRPGTCCQLSDPAGLPAIPNGSVDVLVCDATWLGRISLQWLAGIRHGRREGRHGSSEHVQDASESVPGFGPSDRAHWLYRNYLLWLLGQFKRIVKSKGICVLAYQHALPSAWATLGEALVAAGWLCYGAVPFPRPRQPALHDPYLYPRVPAWDALLICRPKAKFAPSSCLTMKPVLTSRTADTLDAALPAAPLMRVVVERSYPVQALLSVFEFCRAAEKGRLKMGGADRLNLWRALLIGQARNVDTADPGPPECSIDSVQHGDTGDTTKGASTASLEPVLLTDALRSAPDWRNL